jgi:ATP-binding cassette subfamily B protein
MIKKYDSNFKLIWHFLKGSLPFFVLSLISAGMVSFMDMVNPKIVSFTVDSVIGDAPSVLSGPAASLVDMAGGLETLKAQPLIIALAVACVGILAALFRYAFRLSNAAGAETFVRRMRDELFIHIMGLPYVWHGENSTGDIIQRCTSDVQTVKRFVSEQLVQLIRTVILIAMALYFMAGINVTVMLGAAAFIPIIVCYSMIFHSRIGTAFRKVDTEEGKLSSIVQENLTGVRVVRAFGREVYEQERFEKQNAYYTGFWIHLMRLMSAFWSSADILTGMQNLTVLFLGTRACLNGTLTTGSLIALISYNLMLIWPVRMLGRVITEMSKAGISIDRIRYIMNSEPEKDREGALEPPMDRDIIFDHVSYSYEGGTGEALHDISLTIPAGTTLGILGGTGSGKSTLMYLLERLYSLPPENGRILIGDTDIADIDKGYLRRSIGMVLQEPYLFSRTLSENIGIAVDRPGMDQVRKAARLASIDDAIETFTAGYETAVGERGVTLSGGQKQRTAIAQMLIRRSPVMVFDDSLSAVDTETDMKIRHAIREVSGQSTVILIAHRITTLMNADRIIVLDKGRIREQGTHDELLSQNGLYRKIYDLQTAGLTDAG